MIFADFSQHPLLCIIFYDIDCVTKEEKPSRKTSFKIKLGFCFLEQSISSCQFYQSLAWIVDAAGHFNVCASWLTLK